MIKFFLGRPEQLGEWTLSSFVTMLFGLFGIAGCNSLQVGGDFYIEVAMATHLLLWWQIVRGIWALCRCRTQDDLQLAGAVLWWLVLLGLQFLCLLLILFVLTPYTGPPLMQF